MSARFFRRQRVLSVKERESFRRRIDAERRGLNGEIVVSQNTSIAKKEGAGMTGRQLGRVSQFYDRDVQESQPEVLDRIRRMERALKDGMPEHLSKKDKALVNRQVAQDREYLRKHMASRRLHQTTGKHPDFARAVKAVQKEMEPEFLRRAQRYKSGMRELAPDDPNAGNIEVIRPK